MSEIGANGLRAVTRAGVNGARRSATELGADVGAGAASRLAPRAVDFMGGGARADERPSLEPEASSPNEPLLDARRPLSPFGGWADSVRATEAARRLDREADSQGLIFSLEQLQARPQLSIP
jgi:hypothetical protein